MGGESTAFAEVARLLPELSQAELRQVRQRTRFLLGPETDPDDAGRDAQARPRSRAPREDWLLAGIEEELRRRGLIGQDRRLPAARLVSGWAETSARVRRELEHHVGTQAARPQVRAALGRLVGQVLAQHLEDRGLPIGPKTMLQDASRALELVDAVFPGYMAAGLLEACLDPQAVGRE